MPRKYPLVRVLIIFVLIIFTMLVRLHNSISLHLRVLDKKDGKFLVSVFRINLKLHNSSFYDYHSMIFELKF